MKDLQPEIVLVTIAKKSTNCSPACPPEAPCSPKPSPPDDELLQRKHMDLNRHFEGGCNPACSPEWCSPALGPCGPDDDCRPFG